MTTEAIGRGGVAHRERESVPEVGRRRRGAGEVLQLPPPPGDEREAGAGRRRPRGAGLRGGVAVALAFSLPPGPLQGHLMTLTYTAVLFSLLVQGLTIHKLGQRAAQAAETA